MRLQARVSRRGVKASAHECGDAACKAESRACMIDCTMHIFLRVNVDARTRTRTRVRKGKEGGCTKHDRKRGTIV
eukprot:6182594-Pleurochrysis_carterae.AAC.1